MGAADYGDLHAAVYDRIYGHRFVPGAAVRALVTAADGGAVLELGAGTGRLAVPLVEAGVVVDGIEASPAMAAWLRAQPSGGGVGVLQVDLAGFVLARSDYAVAVCAVSTLFMLTHDAQLGCLRSSAVHLRPGGRLFVEAFRPDPARFDAHGRRVEDRSTPAGGHRVVRSVHDGVGRTVRVTHELADGAYEVVLHYRTVAELDSIAALAVFRLVDRWHDWRGRPAQAVSTDPVSVHVLAAH